MATPTQVPAAPLSPQEKMVIVPPTQRWEDLQAYKIASASFESMERYRSQNHDRRFRISDEIYTAWVKRKVWDRTRIPRSSIGVFLMLQQVEALMPSVISALFSDDLFFDAQPMPNSSIEQARAVVKLLRYQMGDMSDDKAFTSLREIFRRVLKQQFMYGNGIAEFGWIISQVQRLMYDRHIIPVRAPMIDPQTGQMTVVPTGDYRFVVKERIENETINKPLMQALDVRDFYINPNCPSHNVQDAEDCAVRNLKPVDWFLQFREQEGFNIPDDKTLMELAQMKRSRQADLSKQQGEAVRGNQWTPTKDYSEDPNKKNIELVRYYQNDRCVWFVPGFDKPLWNQPNEYGMKPFLNSCYVDYPGRFYGLSICDLVEGDQRLAEAILNARIDELNLIIHPPVIHIAGSRRSNAQNRLTPGAQWEVDSKDNIPQKMEWPNVTAQAFAEVAALEQRVQKTTGVTDLAVLGTPASGGNSANRTATGVNTQAAASSKRVQYQVENIEDQFFVPLLNILLHLNKKFLDPNQALKILGQDGQQIELDPLDILNVNVKFSMKASSKMRSKQALASGGLGLILQSYLNPEVMQIASQFGMKLNFPEMDNLVCDTMGLAEKSLWTMMNPEEQQQLQQMNPNIQKMQGQMALQQARLDAMGQQADAGHDAKLLAVMMKSLLDKNPSIREAFSGIKDEALQKELEIKQAIADKPTGGGK